MESIFKSIEQANARSKKIIDDPKCINVSEGPTENPSTSDPSKKYDKTIAFLNYMKIIENEKKEAYKVSLQKYIDEYKSSLSEIVEPDYKKRKEIVKKRLVGLNHLIGDKQRKVKPLTLEQSQEIVFRRFSGKSSHPSSF